MSDFQNPREQDPNFHRRMLLAFALVFLVITGTNWYMQKYGPKPPVQAPAQQQQQQQPTAQPAPAPSRPADTPVAAALTASQQPAAVTDRQAQTEQQLVIENDLYRITFSNRGGQAVSWILKNFKDDFGKPLELINTAAAPQHGYPLSLWTYDPNLRTTLNSALYLPSAEGTLKAPATVSFEYASGGLAVRKSFRFDHSYLVDVETSVTQNGSPVQAYPAWPSGFGDQTVPVSFASSRIIRLTPGAIERVEPKNVSGGNTIAGPFAWAGAEDQYFAAVFMPQDPGQSALITLHNAVAIPKDRNKPDPNDMETVSVLGAAVGNPYGETRGRMYVGPKQHDILKSVQANGSDLSHLVDFGTWFGIIAKPLFLWLKWTHDHWVADWGWAIIVLTIIINFALFPLKYTSMRSSLKMMKIQPQMKAIQERYKHLKMTDPKRAEMQREIQALQKEHGVNPLGGCLPMLLQMPFLIAFYSMLSVAVELRHATWLWIKDLSSPDPIYVLPALIVVTMFIMQRITPMVGMDPMQQKMMTVMMPVMLGFISVTLAAGLGLYWVMGNVIAYAQQLWINNTALGREIRADLARRAAKKKG